MLKLNTGDVINPKIVNSEPFDIYKYIESEKYGEFIGSGIGDEGWIGDEEAIKMLNERNVLRTLEYYGFVFLLKKEKPYRGVLLQYRNISEDILFDDVHKALEWFIDMSYTCIG